MTVNEAIRRWPRLMATGMRLGSPAVSAGAATPGSWLARFMRRAQHRGYRVNFITPHWYGGDFRTGAAVGELKDYLKATWARYHKPIWLTEYALTNFGAKPGRLPDLAAAGGVRHRVHQDAAAAALRAPVCLVRAAVR